MDQLEYQAANEHGEFKDVGHSVVERRYYKITRKDGFKITGSALFFPGAYRDALASWTVRSGGEIEYVPLDVGESYTGVAP